MSYTPINSEPAKGVFSVDPKEEAKKAQAVPQGAPFNFVANYHPYESVSKADSTMTLAEKERAIVSAKVDELAASGNADIEKVLRYIRAYHTLNGHVTGQSHNDSIKGLEDEAEQLAKKNSDTYKRWTANGLQVVSGVMSIAAGVFGLGGAKVVSAALQPAAQGVGSFAQVQSNKDQSERVIHEHNLRTAETQRNHQDQNKRSSEQLAKQTKDQELEAERAKHQAMMGA